MIRVQNMFLKNDVLSAYKWSAFCVPFFDTMVFFFFFALGVLVLFVLLSCLLLCFRLHSGRTIFVYYFHINSGKSLEHRMSLGLLGFIL